MSKEIKGEETLHQWPRSFDKKVDSNEVGSKLGRMLLSGGEQKEGINALSRGGKHRMVLSKLLLEDEPINHLDFESIIALGEALYKFNGNVICVSHDRELIDGYANRIVELNFGENRIGLLTLREAIRSIWRKIKTNGKSSVGYGV